MTDGVNLNGQEQLDFMVTRTDPGVRAIRSALEDYRREFDEGVESLEVYAAIMEVQRKAQGRIKRRHRMGEDEAREKLKGGIPLLEPDWYHGIESDIYLEMVRSIFSILGEKSLQDLELPDVDEWEVLSEGALENTLSRVLRGEPVSLGGGEGQRYQENISEILWEALVPFASRYDSILQEKIEQPSWQKGTCPVCGSLPLMGKIRSSDGLRLLECSLCRCLWMFPRIGCTYCGNREQKTIHYLYLGEERTRRVNICEKCSKYVKTTDERERAKDLILPLENIATMYLDQMAKDQGYNPGNVKSG